MLTLFRDAPCLQMTAAVTCEYETETREYELVCHYEAEGTSVVTVTKPEELSGLAIEFDGEKKTLRYGETCLDAPRLGDEGLSPAEVLPRLMDALRQGYLTEEGKEDFAGAEAWRITLAQEGKTGDILFTIWLSEEDGTPLAATVFDGEMLNCKLVFTSFTFGDIMQEEETALT